MIRHVNQMIYSVYSTALTTTSTDHLPCFQVHVSWCLQAPRVTRIQVLVCLSACVDVSLFSFGGEEAHAQTTSRGATLPEYPRKQKRQRDRSSRTWTGTRPNTGPSPYAGQARPLSPAQVNNPADCFIRDPNAPRLLPEVLYGHVTLTGID